MGPIAAVLTVIAFVAFAVGLMVFGLAAAKRDAFEVHARFLRDHDERGDQS
ncbi:hypothetical protein [Breoghania sp.]|uniref:hypothetical protein n=1 Tax=Breoghania sp. TaxID=2065378 RepID=UPI0029CA0DC8|nr:hypothetical protein [Breoghania sp.]